MKKLVEQYAAYNVWANQQLISCIMQANEPVWYKETPSSFNSIYKTIMHVWGAEAAWLARLRKHEMFELLNMPTLQARQKQGFNRLETDCKETAAGWLETSRQWETLIGSKQLTDEIIAQDFQYKNSRGDEFVQPLYEVLSHVFNHSTYHRGQLVTMLRGLGVDAIPATDFIVYSRGR